SRLVPCSAWRSARTAASTTPPRRACAPRRSRHEAAMLYHRPVTLPEALAIRAAGKAMVLAGGTDVYAESAARVGWGDMRGSDVADSPALAGLRGIPEHAAHGRIGALTTWSDLVATPLPRLFDGCRQAAREIGGPQIQNRGTLGGNICTASAAGDGAPNL